MEARRAETRSRGSVRSTTARPRRGSPSRATGSLAGRSNPKPAWTNAPRLHPPRGRRSLGRPDPGGVRLGVAPVDLRAFFGGRPPMRLLESSAEPARIPPWTTRPPMARTASSALGATEFRRPSALVVRLRRGFAKQSIGGRRLTPGASPCAGKGATGPDDSLRKAAGGTRGPVPGTHGAAAGARPGSAVCPGFPDRFRTRGLTRRSWWRWSSPVRVSGRQYRFAAYSRLHRARSRGPMRSVGSLDLGRGDTSMSATQTSPGTAEACTSREEWARTPSPRRASRRSRTAYRQAFPRRMSWRPARTIARWARCSSPYGGDGTSKTPGAW